MTLSGVSKAERKKRAIEALERVGLKDHLYKKPSQMSGDKCNESRLRVPLSMIQKSF